MEQPLSTSSLQKRGPFIVLGPSGVGKGTLLTALCAELPELHMVVSHTTRARRPAENNPKRYYFISRFRFILMILFGRFAEWGLFPPKSRHAQFYGTSWKELRNTQGIPLLEIDLRGATAIKRVLPSTQLILIEPPDTDTLRERLVKRGTGTPQENEARLARALHELEEGRKIADYRIVNHTGEAGQREAEEELIAILRGNFAHRAFNHNPL